MKNLIIDKKAIKNNIAAVKNLAKGETIIADLAGDAYGMGLLETARLLRDEGIGTFAVAEAADAETLRSAGFTDEKLMMLRSTADSQELCRLMDQNVICTVGSYDAAVAINGIAEARHTVCEVQIKIDTGLGRYGFMASETDKIASIYRYMPNLAIVGVFSTYSESWKNKRVTLDQYEQFKDVLGKLTEMGFELGTTFICDSAALFKYNFGRLDALKIGTAFSGRVAGGKTPGLYRVGYIEAGLEEIGWFPKGHRIGSSILRKPAKLAVVSVGYYHGFGVNRYERELGIIGLWRLRRAAVYVKVNGQRAKVVGSVGMMHTIIDVTKITCAVGDKVIMDVDPVNVKGLARLYR